MNRERLIEQAARNLWDASEAEYWDYDSDRRPFDPSQPDEDGEMTAAEWLKTVTQIADAILPQITAVEELEALPVGTVLLDEDGHDWRRQDFAVSPQPGPLVTGPLTVVWQPS